MAVPNYLKNVTKSIAFTAAEVTKDMMPDVVDFAKSNKDFVKQTYSSIKLPKMDSRRRMKGYQNTKIFQTLDYGMKNIKKDLLSGDFYAKTRADKDFAKLAGIDLDDFEDFNFDFNFDEPTLENKKSTEKNSITLGDTKIVQAVEGSNAAMAQATVHAIVSTAENTNSNLRANAAMMFEQNERIFGAMHQDMSAIGATLQSIFKLQSAVMSNIDKNISSYQTEHLKLENERNAILKEMLEIQRDQRKTAQELESARNRSSKKKRFSDISFGGLADLDAYFEHVRDNIKSDLNLLTGGGNISDTLSTMMVTPTRDMMKFLTKQIIPKTLKASMQSFNESIEGLFANIITRINKAGSGFGAGSLIARYFGIDTKVNRKIDTGKYHKGALAWDGISRKALITVIPEHLRRIETILSGVSAQTYDYDTGKWKKLSAGKEELDKIKKNAVNNATYDLIQAMNKTLEKNAPSGVKARAEYNQAIDEFRQYLYDVDGVFYVYDRNNRLVSASDNGIKQSDYPMLYKYYNKIRDGFRDFDLVERLDRYGNPIGKRHLYGKKMGLSNRIIESKEFENRRLRDAEVSGHSMVAKYSEYNAKALDERKGGTLGILGAKDKFGQTIHSYLHNINQELMFWRLNFGESGFFGGGGSGGSGGPTGGPKVSFKSLNKKLYTQEQRAINNKLRRERRNKNKGTDPDAYKRDIFGRISSGLGINDLRDIGSTQGLEYLLELSRSDMDAIRSIYKEQMGTDMDDATAAVFDKFFKKQFRKANIRSMEDVTRAIDKANSTGKNTFDVLTPQERGQLGKILSKLKGGRDYLSSLFNAPASALTGVIMTADKAVYDMFFKQRVKDDNTNYEGFLNMLVGKTGKVFDTLKQTITEKLIDPLKEALGIEGSYKQRFKDAAKSMFKGGMQGFVKAHRDIWIDPMMSIYYGTNMGQRTISGMSTETFNKRLTSAQKKKYRDEMLRAGYSDDPEALSRRMSIVGFKGSIDQKISKLISLGVDQARIDAAMAHAGDEKAQHAALNKMYNRLDIKRHAKGTRGRGYTGNTMLSQGELLVNDSGVSMVQRTGAYRVSKPTEILNTEDSYDLLNALGLPTPKTRRSVRRAGDMENVARRKMFDSKASGTMGLKDIFGRSTNKEDIKVMLSEGKKWLPEIAVGAGLGGLTSLLLGVIGGPLLGGSLGAGLTLVSKSKSVQRVLFGKMGENGEREDNGIIKKSIQDSVKKYIPSMGKGSIVGLTASLVTPLGPIGGLLVGGALGYLKENEAMREKIFGKISIGSSEKNIIKKMLPNTLKGAGIGAVSGLFLGPFGILGNAAIGAALGMVSSTDEFKDSIFGRVVGGERMGGLVGALKDAFEPIRQAGLDFKDRIFDALDSNIIQPLADFVKPAIHALPQIAGWLPRKLNDLVTDKFKMGMDQIMEHLLVDPLKALFKPVGKLAGNAFKVMTTPFKIVGGVGNLIRKRQMNTMNADYMTADERMLWKTEHGINTSAEDEFFHNIGSDGFTIEQAQALRGNLTDILDTRSSLNASRAKQERAVNDILRKYRTADGGKISYNARKQIINTINTGNEQDIARILATNRLQGSDVGLTDDQIKALMGEGGLRASISKYQDIAERRRRVNALGDEDRDKAIEAARKILDANGLTNVDLTKPSSINKFIKYIDTEIGAKTGKDVEDKAVKFIGDNHENIQTMTDLLTNIAKYGIKIADEGTESSKQALKDSYVKSNKGLDKVSEISDSYQAQAQKYFGKAWNQLTPEQQAQFRGKTKGSYRRKLKGTYTIKNSITGETIEFSRKSKDFIAGLSDKKYKNLKAFLSDKYIGAIVSSGGTIAVDDLKYYNSFSTAARKTLSNKCKVIVNCDAISEFPTIKHVVHAPGFVFRALSNQAIARAKGQDTGVESTSEVPSEGNALGFGLAGLLLKSLFGKKKKTDDEGGGRFSGIKKIGGSIASLFSSGNNNVRASNGISDTNEVDIPGDGRDVAAIGSGFGYIKRKADGSVEPDTTDAKTKQLVQEQNKRQTLLEKLQNAQLKASEALSNAFQHPKEKAQKGMGWLAWLLLGGMLLKSGIVQKLFTGLVKPLWTDHIRPWATDKAIPFLKDEILKPAGDWIINTALPTAGKWIFEKAIPAMAGLVGQGISYLIKELPDIIKKALKRTGDVLDNMVLNPKNVGAKSTIDAKDKTGMSGMVDENGNPLSWEDIAAGNYGAIYNPEGAQGVLNDDGTVTFTDQSRTGSSYASVVGNAAAHGFAYRSVGKAAAQGIATPFRQVGNLASKTGLIGKLANMSIFKPAGAAISKPIKAASEFGSNLISGMQTRARRLVNLRNNVTGLSGAEANQYAKDAATRAGNADRAAKQAAKAENKGRLGKLIDKIAKKTKEIVTAFLNHPQVENKLAKLAGTKVGKGAKAIGSAGANALPTLKKKIINVFDDIILKSAGKKVGLETAKQTLKHLGPIVTVGFLVYDFLSGCDRAESILGIEETDWKQEVVAGLVNALGNFLIIPAIWPGIPGLAQKLYAVLPGVNEDQYQQQFTETEQAYNEYLENTGSTLTKAEWLARDYSATGKIGGLISDGISNFKSGAASLISDAKGLGSKIKGLGSSIGSKLKGIGSRINDFGADVPREALKAKAGVISPIDGIKKVVNSLSGRLDTLSDPQNDSIPARIYQMVTYIPNRIKDIKDSIRKKFQNIVGSFGEKTQEEKQTDEDIDSGKISVFSADYWLSGLPKSGGTTGEILSGIGKTMNRIMAAPILIVKEAISKLIDGVQNLGGWLAGKFGAFSGFFTNPLEYIYKAITGKDDTSDYGSQSSYINQSGKFSTTGTSASTSTLKSALNKASSLVGSSSSGTKRSTAKNVNATKNKSSSVASTVKGWFSSAWSGVKSLFGAGPGPAVVPQYSKQIDPEVANIRFNSGADRSYQTIGDSACGPAAAVNVMESIYGRGNPIADAASFALSHGYKETDGGTRPEFFTDYFARNGVSSSISYNRKQIENRINAGLPTVLMGSDSRGTSNSHPFGRNPHYVTVTGVDSRGNAIVQDPESHYSNQVYKVNDLVRKTTLGVSAYGRGRVTRSPVGRGRYGFGKYGRGKSKMILLGDSRTVGMIVSVYGKKYKTEFVDETDSDGNIWICKVGAGYSYATGKAALVTSRASSEYAVVILMGVNDINTNSFEAPASKYANWANSAANQWIAKGAEVYFMSVPPIDGVYSTRWGKITNDCIDGFNKKLASSLDTSKVRYVDINTPLKGQVKCPIDNLHYDNASSKKVFAAIKQAVTSGASTTVTQQSGTTTGATTAAATTFAPAESRNMLLFEAHYIKDDSGLPKYNGQHVVSSSRNIGGGVVKKSAGEDKAKATDNNTSGTGRFGRSKYGLGRVIAPTAAFGRALARNTGFGRSKYGRGDIENQDLCVWADVTVEEIDAFLAKKAKGKPFEGKGSVFLQVAQSTGFDPAYLIAHAGIESAWGSSNFAKKRGNYFGIGAFDSNPNNAYTMSTSSGEFHPDGLLQGAQWIKTNYYNRGQTTLYLFNHGKKGHAYRTSSFAPEVSIMRDFYNSINGYDTRQKNKHEGNGGSVTPVSGSTDGSTAVASAATPAGDSRNMLLFEAHYMIEDKGLVNYKGYNVTNSSLPLSELPADLPRLSPRTTGVATTGTTATDGSTVLSSDDVGLIVDDGSTGSTSSGSNGINTTPSTMEEVKETVNGVIAEGFKKDKKVTKEDVSKAFNDIISDGFKQGKSYPNPLLARGSNGFKPRSLYGRANNVTQIQAGKQAYENHKAHMRYELSREAVRSRYQQRLKARQELNERLAKKRAEVANKLAKKKEAKQKLADQLAKRREETAKKLAEMNYTYKDGVKVWKVPDKYTRYDIKNYSTLTDDEVKTGKYIFPGETSGRSPKVVNVTNTGYNEELMKGRAEALKAGTAFTPGMMDTTERFIAHSAMGAMSKLFKPSKFGRAKSSIGEFLSNVVANSAAAQVFNSFLDLGISSYDDAEDVGTVTALATTSNNGVATGGGDAANMVRIAQQEEALTDGSNAENPKGSNSVKYNDWYYGKHVSGGSYPWCAAFVAWVANQAGVPTDILPKSASTRETYANVKKHGGQYVERSQAQPGDLAFYSNSAGSPSAISHIGIVEKLEGDTIYTIEGNTTDAVHRRKLRVSDSSKLIARPAYRAAQAQNSAVQGTGDFPKYALSDKQIKGIANIVQHEQPGAAGMQAEASLMANLTDIKGNEYATPANIEAKAKSGWFAQGVSRFNNPGNPSQTAIDAVNKVIVQGRRTVPRYVNEHDYIGDIASISTGSKYNKSDYKPHETIIQQGKSVGGNRWIYYTHPGPNTDPFGYTSKDYRQKWGEAHYNASGGNGFKPRSRFGMAKYGMGNRAAEVWNWFTSHGYSAAATAGILGNMQQESGVDPEVIQGGGRGPAAGIVQWENYNTKSSRWKAMADHAKSKGRNWTDLESQLEWVDKENNSSAVYWKNATTYKSYDAFKQATDIDAATLDFEKAFERAGKPAMANRYKAAHKYYEQFQGTTGTAISGSSSASTDGTTTVAAGPQMSSIGQWLSNVLANSAAGQVLNSFLDFGGGGSTVVEQPAATTDTSTEGSSEGSSDFVPAGNSKLATVVKLSPYNGGQRKHAVDTITIHTMSSNMGAEQCCQYFITGRHDASCNYCIGSDGTIALCVEEKNRTWCSSSRENDDRAITFEVASLTTNKEPYPCSDQAYEAIIKLCTDICQRYGKTKMIWIPNKAETMKHKYAPNEMRMTIHKWFKNKACPGQFLESHMGDIAAKVNARLAASAASPGGYKKTSTNAVSGPVTGQEVQNALSDQIMSGFTGKGSNGFKPRSMYGMAKFGNVSPETLRAMDEAHRGNKGSSTPSYGTGNYGMPKSEADITTINYYKAHKEKIHYGEGTGRRNKYKMATIRQKVSFPPIGYGRAETEGYDRAHDGQQIRALHKAYQTVHFGRGTGDLSGDPNINWSVSPSPSASINYSGLFRQVVSILLRVASNTDKLSTIISILNNKLNINITAEDIANAQNGDSSSERLAAAIANASNASKMSKLNTYADTIGDSSIYNIISAMNAIASE